MTMTIGVGALMFFLGIMVGRGEAVRLSVLHLDLVRRSAIFEEEVRLEDDTLADRAILRTRNLMADGT